MATLVYNWLTHVELPLTISATKLAQMLLIKSRPSVGMSMATLVSDWLTRVQLFPMNNYRNLFQI